jgi:hypothetical protein
VHGDSRLEYRLCDQRHPPTAKVELPSLNEQAASLTGSGLFVFPKINLTNIHHSKTQIP